MVPTDIEHFAADTALFSLLSLQQVQRQPAQGGQVWVGGGVCGHHFFKPRLGAEAVGPVED